LAGGGGGWEWMGVDGSGRNGIKGNKMHKIIIRRIIIATIAASMLFVKK
jgi:hypothetical protein